MNKCILCGRCVGRCQEINGAGAIDFIGRGFSTIVGPAFGDPIEESSCVFCGMCVDVCPVGALIPKAGVGKGRPWEVEKVKRSALLRHRLQHLPAREGRPHYRGQPRLRGPR